MAQVCPNQSRHPVSLQQSSRGKSDSIKPYETPLNPCGLAQMRVSLLKFKILKTHREERALHSTSRSRHPKRQRSESRGVEPSQDTLGQLDCSKKIRAKIPWKNRRHSISGRVRVWKEGRLDLVRRKATSNELAKLKWFACQSACTSVDCYVHLENMQFEWTKLNCTVITSNGEIRE